jgi:hypothetical protein
MISIALRHSIRHWRLDLTILLTLALGTTILISLSCYEAVISNQELHRTLALAPPAGRSLLITGSPYTFDETLYKNLQSSLDAAFKERIEIRHAKLQADPQPAAHLIFNRIDVYSFDSIAGHVRVIEGRLPEQMHLNQAVGPAPPVVEAVIGLDAAEQAGYQIGDRLTASDMYHRFIIVGIIKPLDANDDAWGGDLRAFHITGDPTLEEKVLPLIIEPNSMRSYIVKPVFPHQIYWRITLDREHILSQNVENLRANLINFETQAGTHGAVSTSDLTQILDDHRAKLSPVHTMLFWLGLQSAIILLIALAALASTQNQSLQIELSTFPARGANLWQTISPIALKFFVISMFASLICGPCLAQALIFLSHPDSNTEVLRPLPGSTWLIAAILAGAGWLALTLPVLFALRLESGRNHLVRPWIQRYSLDLYLFAFGSLLFWQLHQSGSFLTQQLSNHNRFFDPLLVAGPSLMIAACAMLAIRLLPVLGRSIAPITERLQGSVLHLGVLRLIHDAQGAGWVLLLAGMVSAQCVFNLIFMHILVSNPGALQVPSLGLGLSKVMWLNALILILFTVSLFFLLGLFMIQERMEEFQVLRALGLSSYQGRLALNIECLPSLLLGVLVGTILGSGLLFMLFNYLTQIFGKAVIVRPDWWTLAQLDAGLFFTFGIALLLPSMIRQGSWISFQRME